MTTTKPREGMPMIDAPSPLSRREWLQWSAAGATALAVAPSSPLAAQTSAYPPDVGRKFSAAGKVLPFAGNTIICHLPQQGEHAACFDAMLDIYRDAPSHDFCRKIALLPPSSYHMTVFGGANDHPRQRESWPADLPLDLAMADCSRIMAERLRHGPASWGEPIRMRIDPEQQPDNGHALIFLLRPADDAQQDRLQRLRRQLSDALGIRPPNLESYRFHMSLGYPIGWFTPEEMADLQRNWARWVRDIAARSPVITLGAPEYCTFEDMYAFHRQFYLGQRA